MLEKTGWLVHKSNRTVSRYGFLPPGIQIYHRNMSQQEKESIYVMESN